MRISRETVEKINFAADIVDVVGDFVALKKKGKDYTACCPFHNEKTPSFYVVPTKNIFYCFGCGKGGDSVNFIMEHESLSYYESLKYLANKYSIEIEEEESSIQEDQKAQAEKESIFAILNFAKNHFKDNLFHTEDGKSLGLSYFKERGLSHETLSQFELGYSLDIWDDLLKTAQKSQYSDAVLEKSGLIVVKEDKKFDRFKGRIIFPIHNTAGRVVGFGGRILSNDKTQAKYINSPETEVYKKSQVLFGLYQAKKEIKQKDVCYLTEGYMDVITLHQAGIQNVVASSGTSLTEDQITLIGRFTKNLTVLYDGDVAGIRASLRGIDLILSKGLNVRVVTFPDNHDPDSYLRKVGATEFIEHLEKKSVDFVRFKASLGAEEAAKDPVKKAQIVHEIMETIALIPDSIKRQVFISESAKLLQLPEELLISEVNKLVFSSFKQAKDKIASQNQAENTGPSQVETPDFTDSPAFDPQVIPTTLHFQEMEYIRLLLRYATVKLDDDNLLGEYMIHELENIDFQSPLYQSILNEFKIRIAEGALPDYTFWTQHESADIRMEAAKMLTNRYELSENWKTKYEIYTPTEEEIITDILNSNLVRLKWRFLGDLLKKMESELKSASTEEDIELILFQYSKLKKKEMLLAKELGIIIG